MSLASELRKVLQALTDSAGEDLQKILRQLNPLVTAALTDGDPRAQAQLAIALRDLIPGLVDRYTPAAGDLAAQVYDRDRERQGIKGKFQAEPVDLGTAGADALAGWGVDKATKPETLESLLTGGITKRIMQSGNQTVMGASIDDPQSDGWQRQTRSSACYFCRMLASRGAVYSEASVDFAAHDTCHCVATSAWTDLARRVKPYTPSPVGTTPKERAAARKWIADHPDHIEAAPKIGTVTRDGVKAKQHEIDTADRLAALGHDVEFRAPARKGKNPDLFLDGDREAPWEAKSPEGNSDGTIEIQFERAVKQSDRLILDLTRSDRDRDAALAEARAAFRKYTGIREVLILDERNRVIELLERLRR